MVEESNILKKIKLKQSKKRRNKIWRFYTHPVVGDYKLSDLLLFLKNYKKKLKHSRHFESILTKQGISKERIPMVIKLVINTYKIHIKMITQEIGRRISK